MERPTPGASLAELAEAAATCTNCELHRNATQTVFGEGPEKARVVLVGEQPGDQEDKKGAPFVGPSGGLLDKALVDAGIDRDDAYVTNVVKHFNFVRRGKRRIHQKPKAEHINACRPWLEGEIDALHPEVVVPLGATAAKALLGSSFKVTQQRGELIERDGMRWVATIHPSAIIRLDGDERRAAYAEFVDDLTVAAKLLG